jgi:hypothetical protein
VGAYDATSGQAINASLISGLTNPFGLATTGGVLFVVNAGDGTVGEYNLGGTAVNSTLLTGLPGPRGIAVSRPNLFVTFNPGGAIGEFTTAGVTVNGSLVMGLSGPIGVAESDGSIFVANNNNGTVGKYTAAGGTVNPALISGLAGPTFLAIVPEPSTSLHLSISRLTSTGHEGHILLQGTGSPNSNFSVEAAPDLNSEFVIIGFGTLGADGLLSFEDSDAGSLPRRFYRVLQ